MPDDDWQNFWHYEDKSPDTLSWILFAAGVVAIVIMVFWYAFGVFDLRVTDFNNAARIMTER